MTSRPPTPVARELRRARAAGTVFFVALGFGSGAWLVSLPALERRLGVGHTLLGLVLLTAGCGAVVGMQVLGPVVDRVGAARALRIAAPAFAATLLGPALAASAVQLFVAAFVLGVGTGSLDVAVNAHGVQVERRYGRPILAAFHATYSLGGVLVAGFGGVALGAGWRPVLFLPVTAALIVAACLVAGPGLLRPTGAVAAGRAGEAPARVDGPGATAGDGVPGGRRIWLLCLLAALLMISEGVAYNWSTVHVADVLGAPASVAAWAYGAFALTMTAGRFLTDRVVARIGPVRVIRFGALVAACGLALAVSSGRVPLAVVGWAVFGAGLSGTIPQVFTAAGNLGAGAGRGLARVVGAGYVGELAGPGIIGLAAHVVPLGTALLLPVGFCVLAACGAGAVAARPNPSRRGGVPVR